MRATDAVTIHRKMCRQKIDKKQSKLPNFGVNSIFSVNYFDKEEHIVKTA